MSGVTYDTGALIALERGTASMRAHRVVALRERIRIVVPAAVVGEWWRGRSDVREAILESVLVEHLTPELAKRAGEALAAVRDATLVDAIVMASAASRGDVVYTSDPKDLTRLHEHFRSVRRVIAV
ncbi:MAG: twitching motility protein PilT [Deltaproteobacteria bacterium]|nr:twitching motility protein PilT [Deltaproteobacteria bacterium]